MSKSQPASLTSQAFWLMVARTLGFVFGFALPLLLVRVLNPTQIGIYRQAFLILATAVNILPLGMHVSAFYYLSRETERRASAVLNILIFLGGMGLMAGVLLIVWPEVLGVVFRASQLVSYGRIIGVLIFLWLFSSFLETVATANQDVTLSTWFIIMAQLSKTVLLAGGALIFRTVEAVLYGAVIQALLQTLVLLWYVNNRFPGFYRHFSPSLFREQTSYAVPFGVAGVIYTTQSDFHSYLVAASVPPSDYAVYSIGTSQLPLVNLLRDSINTVLLSRISKLQQEGREPEIRSLVFRAVRKILAFYLPVVAALLLLGRELLTAMYTKQYLASWPIFAINITLLPFNALLSDAILRSYPEARFKALRIRICVLVTTVGLCIAGFKLFGMIGAITAATLGMMVERTSLSYLGMRMIQVSRKDFRMLRDVPRFALASVLAFAAGSVVRWLCAGWPVFLILLVVGATFGLVFAAAILLLGVLEDDERQMINSSARRILGRELLAPVRSRAAEQV